jgi:hypothetical protein
MDFQHNFKVPANKAESLFLQSRSVSEMTRYELASCGFIPNMGRILFVKQQA